ncbi:hypothetical protein [Flavobacterium hungaricum]|uniref:PEP-CTERM protein-sorting domain-containing protein n=1 Tax=Flavobacterium hungaricum TaxID=2082725 RepID=A0ABR9TQJ8_9FLAO|nr:hypothetical protein [Flavobacterium hungaricum]MBE8727287.1 hypothetical protein [Flavobacterium hungaricum]
MKKLQAPYLLIALLLLNVSVASAQGSGNPGPPGTVPVTPGTPIDENIVFLVIAGTALGIAVLYKNKIKKASV